MLLRALLVNCDLHHSFEEASCASIMKTKQEHAHGLHLFRKDALPHSMLVVAIILAVVLLIL